MGENITTRGVDLLALPTGTSLRIGPDALVAVTGLRNPCRQLDAFLPGLMGAVLDRRPDGTLARRAGVMGVVVLGGRVAVGDPILVGTPPGVPTPLAPV
jgi:MOSC domain-containing protein YiiM